MEVVRGDKCIKNLTFDFEEQPAQRGGKGEKRQTRARNSAVQGLSIE